MYNYSLRVQFSPNLDYEERMENLLDFCNLAKIDDVMFFIAAEDLFPGQVTKEQADKYVEIILKAKKILAEKGITVSLNPWTTLGHYDGGRKLKEGQNFDLMVGHNGVQADVCVCPESESWRKYYAQMLNYYIEKIDPETLWLEDDFRLYNKQTKKGFIGLACFCDKHMQLISNALGEKVSREDFVKRLSTDLKARKVYLDVMRKTMEDTLNYLSKEVKGLNRFGLMTGGVSFEHGRRFGEFFKILKSDRKKPRNRQALCCYRQISGQNYMSNVNRFSFLVRALTGDTAECVSEIENFPHGTQVKSVKFAKFQMLSSIPLLFMGATFSIFDFTGNGAIEYERLANTYAQIKPFMSKVQEFNLLPENAVGIKILVNQDVTYTSKIDGDYVGTDTHDTGYLFAMLEMLGISCAYTENTAIKGETVGVSGQVLRSLGVQKVKELFKNNFVILMGDGVEALFEMGLNHLISAKSYERLVERDDPHTMEQLSTDEKVCGITKLRATNHYASGDYINIVYDGETTVYTDMLNCFEQKVGDGLSRSEKALIIPFTPWYDAPLPYSLFTKLREYTIKKALYENAVNYFTVAQTNVSPYVFEKDGLTYVMCVNFSDDDYDFLDISTDKKFSEFTLHTVENPSGATSKVEKTDDGYKIKETLKGLEAFVLVCK